MRPKLYLVTFTKSATESAALFIMAHTMFDAVQRAKDHGLRTLLGVTLA